MLEKLKVTKSFDDLILEVHNRGICGECGGYISFCSTGKYDAIQMTDHGPPTYKNKDNCLSCGLCYLICPQIEELNSDLHKKFFH